MAIKINLGDGEFVLDYLAEEKGYDSVEEFLKQEHIQPIIDKNQNRVIRVLTRNYLNTKKKEKEKKIDQEINDKEKNGDYLSQENEKYESVENQNYTSNQNKKDEI